MSHTLSVDPPTTHFDPIKKYRAPSLTLESLIAAQNRLIANHPLLPTLMTKQSSVQAGIGGEERVQQVISQHTFPQNFHFFYDLTLSSFCKFQLDCFLLTPYYGIIFEVKNISGRLKFLDDPPQLVQTKDTGEVNGLDSPAAQVERYAELLAFWFKSRNIQLPIYRVVVLAYPKQIVDKAPAKTKILFPNSIPSYIRSLPQDKNWLDMETFLWVSTELINSHIPFIPDPVCATYHISKNDIRTGVICRFCGHIGMKKTKRSWCCPVCESYDHLAHHPALRDWFLIMGSNMTNADCREFLHVDRHSATRILKGKNLKREGAQRNWYYIMDFS